jgi:hypothetical protein
MTCVHASAVGTLQRLRRSPSRCRLIGQDVGQFGQRRATRVVGASIAIIRAMRRSPSSLSRASWHAAVITPCASWDQRPGRRPREGEGSPGAPDTPVCDGSAAGSCPSLARLRDRLFQIERPHPRRQSGVGRQVIDQQLGRVPVQALDLQRPGRRGSRDRHVG